MRYTANDLNEMPSIIAGQFDDLKVKTNTTQVWLSRMTRADGARYNNGVTVETRNEIGHWVVTARYPG